MGKKGNITFNNLYQTTKKAVTKVADKVIPNPTKIINKAVDYGKTAVDVGNKLINGTTEVPPNFKRMQEKYGDKKIVRMQVVRQPLQQALEIALDKTSQGKLGKEQLSKENYDKLYHLKLEMNLEGVDHPISIEKEAVVTLVYDPKHGQGFETMPINKDFHELTLNELISNAQNAMGGKFISYSSKDNNCQDFVMGLLNASHLSDEEIKKFVKQDLSHLFSNSYRKLTNTITNIGSKAEILKQGGSLSGGTLQSIIFDKTKFSKDEAEEWMEHNDKPVHKIDITSKHIRFRQAPPKRGAKYYIKHIEDGVEFIFFEDAKNAQGEGIKHIHHHHHHHYGEQPIMNMMKPPPLEVESKGEGIKKRPKKIVSLINQPFKRKIVDLRLQGKNPAQPKARSSYVDLSVPDPYSSSDSDSD